MASKSKSRVRQPRTSYVSAEDMMRWTVRLEDSIQKLATATTELSTGIAAHTQRLNNVEHQSEQNATDYRSLSERITTVQQQLTTKLEETTAAVNKHIDDSIAKFTEERKAADERFHNRLRSLEKWRWILLGGSALAAFLLIEIFRNIFAKIDWTLFIK